MDRDRELEARSSLRPISPPSNGLALFHNKHRKSSRVENNNNLLDENLEPGEIRSLSVMSEILKDELKEKQSIIDRLFEDLTEKKRAIELCGKDIQRIQEENYQLKNNGLKLSNEIEKMKKTNQLYLEIQQKEFSSSSASSSIDYNQIDPQISNQIIEKYRQKNEFLQNELNNQQTIINTNEQQIHELNSFKLLYNNLIKKLNFYEKDEKKITKYKYTILKQEKLIQKLTGIMESKIKSKLFYYKNEANLLYSSDNDEDFNEKNEILDQNNRLLDNNNENIELKNEIIQLKEQINLLELQKNQENLILKNDKFNDINDENMNDIEAEEEEEEEANFFTLKYLLDHPEENSSFKFIKNSNRIIDQLIAELIARNYRLTAIEKQLENVSRTQAQESSRMRTRIVELEVSLALANEGLDIEEEIQKPEEGKEETQESKDEKVESKEPEEENEETQESKEEKEESKEPEEENEETQESKEEKEESKEHEEVNENEINDENQEENMDVNEKNSIEDEQVEGPKNKIEEEDQEETNDEPLEEKKDHEETKSKSSLYLKIFDNTKDGTIEKTLSLVYIDQEKDKGIVVGIITAELFHKLKEISGQLFHYYSFKSIKLVDFNLPNEILFPSTDPFSLSCDISILVDDDIVWTISTPEVSDPGKLVEWKVESMDKSNEIEKDEEDAEFKSVSPYPFYKLNNDSLNDSFIQIKLYYHGKEKNLITESKSKLKI